DNVTTTTIGNWVRTRTWQGWRDVVDVDEQKWTGSSSRVVASYLGHYDWRGNRESMQLTGELATSQGHASGVVTEDAMFKSGDVWGRDELREPRARQLDTSAELTARYRQWGYDGAHSRTSENRTGGWAASYSNND